MTNDYDHYYAEQFLDFDTDISAFELCQSALVSPCSDDMLSLNISFLLDDLLEDTENFTIRLEVPDQAFNALNIPSPTTVEIIDVNSEFVNFTHYN